jgi:hypothetical protein
MTPFFSATRLNVSSGKIPRLPPGNHFYYVQELPRRCLARYSDGGEVLTKIKRCLIDNGRSDQATPTDGELFVAVSAVYSYKCADILPVEISRNCLITG